MEADLHQHIHLENKILFRRAIELESHPRREWITYKSVEESYHASYRGSAEGVLGPRRE